MCLQISEIEIFLHKKNIDNYLIADRKRITVLFYPKKLLNPHLIIITQSKNIIKGQKDHDVWIQKDTPKANWMSVFRQFKPARLILCLFYH